MQIEILAPAISLLVLQRLTNKRPSYALIMKNMLKVVMYFCAQFPTHRMIYFNRRIYTQVHESSE